jgi:DNA-binding response OmpR family regulator
MKVLIVDDSLTVRMDLDEAFQSVGWTTLPCGSAAQAQEELSKSPKVDVLILDVLLPDGSGIDLLRKIRNDVDTAGIPVILLSTKTEVADQLKGLGCGADDYIGKPYDRSRIVSRAEELARGREPRPFSFFEDLYGPAKILAVDDSRTYLHALAAEMSQDGHDVLPASSGEEALRVLSVHTVDCILLDLLMPGMSGEETCRRIKANPEWRAIPVIMLTGTEDRQAMIESFNAGADDFVPKSTEAAVLRARLRAQLRRKKFEDELHHKEIEIAEARAARELAETRATLLSSLQLKNAELEENQAKLQRVAKELEEAKNIADRARAEAELANHAKDHFLAVLSHELRTPLTPVVMGLSVLQDKPGLDPKMRETLEMIRNNVDMEARLIDDLLDVTRIARGKIELNRTSVELSAVIRDAVEVCKPDIEDRRLHFGVDLGQAPYWIKGDGSRLQQVFWNLLKNSIKFTPPGGCVGIRCRQDNGCVQVEVNDSGIGIEPEVMPRVFDAFEQAERSITRQFGGLGLGLAISKALVELHGGEIEAYSEGKNKGATFCIRLPLSAPVPQDQANSSSARIRGVDRPLRILLVEDHGVTAQMIRMVLTEKGHLVQTAGDISTALELVNGQAFDLLLSDLGLPDGSGHDLIKELRARGHNLPGIALSGYGHEEDIRRSYQAGFFAHLIKPASREKIFEAVEAAVGFGLTTSDPNSPPSQ